MLSILLVNFIIIFITLSRKVRIVFMRKIEGKKNEEYNETIDFSVNTKWRAFELYLKKKKKNEKKNEEKYIDIIRKKRLRKKPDMSTLTY